MGEILDVFDIGRMAMSAGATDIGKVAATGGFDAFKLGGVKAAESAGERIIGAKSAETVAAEQAAGQTAERGAEDAAKSGKSGSWFAKTFRRLTGAGGAGALGYGASKLGSALGSLGSGDQNGSNSPDLNAVVPNPGAFSPAGEVKVPDVGIAPDLAGEPAPSENIEGSSAHAGYGRDDAGIIAILKQILEQEKASTSKMSQGFADMARMQAGFIRSTVAANQAHAIEATSSGQGQSNDRGSGSLFTSAISSLGSSMKAIAGGIGIAAIAGALTTVGRDVFSPDQSSAGRAAKAAETSKPATVNNDQGKAAQHDLEAEYKHKYGNDWPEKLVEAIFSRLKSDPGFQKTEKSDKGDAAYLLYTQIKEIYDKANPKEQRELEASIGKEIGVDAKEVRRKIDIGEGLVGTAAAASTGIALAIGLGGAETVGSLGKAATFIGGGLVNAGAYLARSAGAGGTADKMESFSNRMVDSNVKSINDWEKDRVAGAKETITPVEQALMANHSTAATVGSVGMSLAVSGGTGSEARVAPKSIAAEINHDTSISKSLSEKQKQAIEYFTKHDWTQAQAEGIVANLTAESHLKTDAVGDNGKAYGIAQWHPDRQKMFERVIGRPIRGSNLEDQLRFVNWELNNSHKSAGDALRQKKDARSAAMSVDQKYEVSAERFGRDASKRGDIADSLADSMGSGSMTSSQFASSASASQGQASPSVADVPAAASPAVASAGGDVNTNVTNDNRRTTVSHTSVNASSAAMPSSLAPHVT